ncbi:protein of unknown function [Xenorhabdus nematophila AN6/1]|nr:protein of unknown function [Xenorhabdus nematophila AN6/1]
MIGLVILIIIKMVINYISLKNSLIYFILTLKHELLFNKY